MEISIIRKPELVVAIDFGSTYTGYAWQWRADFLNNRSNVQFNNNWGSGALQLHKTSTCILLEAKEKYGMEYKIDSFGQMAEDIYKKLCKEKESDIPGKWYFFKRFKHLLFLKDFHKEIQAEDQIGQHVPLLDVVTKLIYALKNHFIGNLKQNGQNVEMDKILWVLTVPAILSNEAKCFMRKAAEMSGIKQKNLLLALESEAAVISCIHLPNEQQAIMNERGTPEQVFLTANLGGLNTEFSAFKVLKNGLLEELFVTKVTLAGWQNVNDAFFQVCHDSIDGDSWKQTFGKTKPTERKDIEDDFKETYSIICNTMQKELKTETLRECKTILLVGGFAESPIVVQHIRKIFAETFPEIRVVVPTAPFKAVLNGAVLYGHDPMILRGREKVNKKLPNEENKKYNCRDSSAVHFEKGDSVVQNEKLEQLMYKDRKSAKFALHTSTSVGTRTEEPGNTMYTTNDGTQKREKVVHSQDTTRGEDIDLFYVLPFLVI